MYVIDAHCHVISEDLTRYPRSPIGGQQPRPVTAEEMAARMDEAGIEQAVLVQATAMYGGDNSYVVDTARHHPGRFVAVGAFDPLPPDAPGRLAALAGDGGLAGVLLFTGDTTVPSEWFAAPGTFPFWRAAEELDLTVCLDLRPGTATKQLRVILERFPGVRVLLGLAASPAEAGREVAGLARHPGLHLKLTHRDLEPLRDAGKEAAAFLEPVVEAFGPERIAWGSNGPADGQPLPELLRLAQDVLADLPASAQEEIFAGTARRLYPGLTRAPEPSRTARTRHDQAYEGLRSLLLSGGIEPGARLTEAELTGMFNVSRSTMRAVLVQLAQEGYVTSEVNRGVRARSFSVEEALDILEAREVLESALAGKAAERATEEEIRGLRGTLEAMEECERRGDQAGYSQGNRRFHQQVKEAAHQRTLARAYDTLLYPLVMRQYRNLSAHHPRAGSLEEHQSILLAIVTRNPEAAVAAMRHHVASARQALLLVSASGNA